MMNKYLFFGFLLFLSSHVIGQGYNTAIGVRLGDDLGFTVQQRIANRTTIEGLFYGGRSNPDTYANVLAQRHFSLLSKKLNAYVGLGLGSHWQYVNEEFEDQQFTIPGVIGLEATFGRLNLSGDVMPHLILNNNDERSYKSIANVSLRIVIVKRKLDAKDKLKEKFSDLNNNKRKKKKKKS